MDNKPNVVVPTATATSTLTETHKAVFTAVGVISSFFVGMAFMFALARLVEVPVYNNDPLIISRVNEASIARTYQNLISIDSVFLTGENGTVFGIMDYNGSIFTSSIATSATPTQLSLQVATPNDAMVIAIATDQGTVNVCLPQNTANPTPRLVRYYVDTQGNVYADKYLTQRVNPGYCPTILAKSYKPATLTNASMKLSSATQLAAFPIGIYRGHNHLLATGTYGGNLTAMNTPVTPKGSMIPLSLFAAYSTGGKQVTIPGGSISVSPNGTDVLTLCLPQTTLPNKVLGNNTTAADHIIYFFDSLGNPYSDPFLQNKVTCQLPTPPACTCLKGTEACCPTSSTSTL